MAEAERQLVSQADYARHRACSEAHVSKLKSSGWLVMEGDLVDVAASDAKIAENSDPGRGGDRSVPAQQAPKADAPAGSYLDSRNREAAARAAMSELDLAKRRGELVERADVEREVYSLARSAQRALLLMPDECASLVPDAVQDEVRKILTARVLKLCEELGAGIGKMPPADRLAWLEREAAELREQIAMEKERIGA